MKCMCVSVQVKSLTVVKSHSVIVLWRINISFSALLHFRGRQMVPSASQQKKFREFGGKRETEVS